MVIAEPKVLTLSQQVAIEAIQADIVRLRNKLRTVMEEAGLDPDKKYSISPAGVVTDASDLVL